MKRVLSAALLCAVSFFGVSGSAYAEEYCRASWYGPGLEGNDMANGRPFNPNDPTVVAHKTLPFGTRLRVHNLDNGRSVDVIVQDRGPFVSGRCVDLSRGAATKLGMINAGTARVRVQYL